MPVSEIPFVELKADPSDSFLIVVKVKVENFYLKYKILLKRHKNENMSTPIMGMLCCSPCVCVCVKWAQLHQEKQILGKVASWRGCQALEEAAQGSGGVSTLEMFRKMCRCGTGGRGLVVDRWT